MREAHNHKESEYPPMALKTKVSKAEYEKLGDGIKEHYTASGDGYRLDADYEDVAGLKSTLEKKKQELADLKATAAKYADIDPEKAREALQAIADLDEKKAKDAGEFDRLLKKEKDAAAVKLDALQKQLDAATNELTTHRLTAPVKDAAIKAGILPDLLDDVVSMNTKRFKLTDKGKIQVLDDDGDPTATTLEDYWGKSYKEARPHFYAAGGAGGSGSNGSKGTATGKTYTRKQYNDVAQSNPVAAAAMMQEVQAKTATLID